VGAFVIALTTLLQCPNEVKRGQRGVSGAISFISFLDYILFSVFISNLNKKIEGRWPKQCI
jgi:hypothetical protein